MSDEVEKTESAQVEPPPAEPSQAQPPQDAGNSISLPQAEATPSAPPEQTPPVTEPQIQPLGQLQPVAEQPQPSSGQTEIQPPIQPEISPVSLPPISPRPVSPQSESSPPISSPPALHPPVFNPIPSLLAKARDAIFSRKRKKLEKILKFTRDKRKITNDDIQKLLRVSDATATRYLAELEKQGNLKQIGKTGQAVFYEPAP